MTHIAGSDPVTHMSIGGATLRLYNPETWLWKLYLIGVKTGTVLMPPAVGRFHDNGRGTFYDFEVFRGQAVLVRYLWTTARGDSIRFEQAFSTDAGKTWETNWIYTATRIE